MNQAPIDSTGASRGNVRSYVTGTILSIVLTATSFGLAMGLGAISHATVFAGIFGAAALQILVQLHYFLHMDTTSKARWNVLTLVFTLLIMTLFIGGSIWIMSNLNYRMM